MGGHSQLTFGDLFNALITTDKSCQILLFQLCGLNHKKKWYSVRATELNDNDVRNWMDEVDELIQQELQYTANQYPEDLEEDRRKSEAFRRKIRSQLGKFGFPIEENFDTSMTQIELPVFDEGQPDPSLNACSSEH